ncbi:MAG: transcription elongation factor GreA [Erysipelotrichaceae bacterium]
MAEKKVYVTQEGLNELIREHENLIHVVRKAVIEELQEARAQGDLSENADYDAARDHQARVEARINELESMLANIELIDESALDGGSVKLGSKVRLLDLSNNEEESFTIVGSVESDPLNGKLSNITPLALAIMDAQAGDVCRVINIDEPYEVKVLDVQ